jgi:Fe-S oxidoreductase
VLIRSLRSPMREKLSMKLAVHESCHENRNADSNKQLQLLQNILDEPPRPLSSIKRQEPCCGCSGSMSETHPDIARNAATALLERAGLAGFEFVLSLSPSCAQHLREAAADRPDLPNTVDIVDLLEQCLRENHGSWGK